MIDISKMGGAISRRSILTRAAKRLALLIIGNSADAAYTRPDKFDFLSKNGNSNCSKQFLDSISTMRLPLLALEGLWRVGQITIREHGFDGMQVTEVWNMSNGCGGA